jgi:hypothetical protein
MNKWLEERRDILIKELVEGYFECKSLFTRILKDYEDNGTIQFSMIDHWVGTEMKKGSLWNLKDVSHNLFRMQGSNLDLVEYIFDWTLGSIFHEVMKLKEDAYQLEAYRPDEEKIKELGNDEGIQLIMEEYNIIIGNAQKNLKSEVDSIQYLFSKSDSILKCLLPRYATNGPLLRFLMKNYYRIQELLDAESLSAIFKAMYGEEWDKAFIVAAKSYLDGGWYDEAKEVLEMGIHYFPHSQEMEDILVKLQVGGMSKS